MGLWPQFRSPLVWDVFAVTTYALVSLMFWYMGLIPDLATLRDRAHSAIGRYTYGALAMGWRGSARHWYRYRKAYFLMAALATPLVISVHSIVGLDFAISVIPGWHSTVFPPYFVAGAVFSGFAMVMTIAIPLRRFYHLEDFITMRHLDNMAKIMLAMGLIVAYGYLMENFFAWYSGDIYEIGLAQQRWSGFYSPVYWTLIFLNVGLPLAFWFRRVRTNTTALFILSILINLGMWIERFIIVVTSLSTDYLTSSWGVYIPSIWDWATFVGTLGFFFALIFLFIRFLPVISIFEMRELVKETEGEATG
jgi:molybdopterin-containing oxidoreductase family membrane subunit